jgi:uncharacterized spore protein YtfJ
MSRTESIDVEGLLATSRDALTVRRVFGDPVSHNGVDVIPVARIRGGGGGGGGSGPAGEGSGSGAGFGMTGSPAGVFVVSDVDVTWKPAINRERILLAAMALTAFALWMIRSSVRQCSA